jgi:nitroreductase
VGSSSIWHWVVLLFVLAVFLGLPAWFGVRIASRAGFSPASGVLLAVPLVGIVTLWVWAFRRWPALEQFSSGPTDRG